MPAVRHPGLPGSLLIDGPFGQPFRPDHRRLLYCLAISALALGIGLGTIKVSLRFDFAALIPAIFEVTLRERPTPDAAEPSKKPLSQTEAPSPPAPVEAVTTEEAPAAPPVPGMLPETSTPAAAVDWYEALEDAAAEIGERHAAVDSLHPEFDELRRIAAQRYGEPQTRRPPPPWENVEKDVYGRTVLNFGNCFKVIDDENLGNRYAFETFERNLVQCRIPLGKRRPENLPWVEVIRAKYPHLRDPDGSQSAAGRIPPHPD